MLIAHWFINRHWSGSTRWINNEFELFAEYAKIFIFVAEPTTCNKMNLSGQCAIDTSKCMRVCVCVIRLGISENISFKIELPNTEH